MTEQQNPYQAPEAELIATTDAGAGELVLTDPKAQPIGAGWTWIAEGFGLFKKSPGLWIGMIIVWFILLMVLGFIPFIGQLASYILGPVFMAGFILGSHELEQGRDLSFNHLFAGFSNNTGQLVLVGVLYMVGLIVAIIPGALVMGGSFLAMLSGDAAAMSDINWSVMAIGFLLMMALIVPVSMAYWFAPALVVLHGKSAVDAMTLSFKGCLKNMLPYLWFSLIVIALCFLAMIPLGLGYLVLMPVLVATMYTAYRAIFTEQ